MGSELVAEYIFEDDGKMYSVYGCWDHDTPENTYDYFEVEDNDGNILNLGEPWFFEGGVPGYEDFKKYMRPSV